MAVRQYIGARYVPKFIGDWSPLVTYEPLSIVIKDEKSYISKKVVPINTPLPDGTQNEWWFLTGVTSAQILQINQRLDSITNRLDIFEAQTAEDLATMLERIAAQDTSINNLQSQVNAQIARNRKFVLIADSYGQGTTAGGQTVIGWTQRFKSYLGLSDDQCTIEQTGGTGFIGNVTDTFSSLITAAAQRLNAIDRSNVTDVVIAGGYNDRDKNADQLVAAANEAATNAKNNFPNAVIHIGMCGYNCAPNGSERDQLMACASYYSRLQSGRVHTMGEHLRFCLTTSPIYMSSDYFHPTQAGYDALARTIISEVVGGGATISGIAAHVPTLTAANGITFAANPAGWYERISRGGYTFFIPGQFEFFKLGSTKPGSNTAFKLADLTNNLGHGMNANTYMFKPWNGLLNNNGVFYEANMNIAIANNALWVKLTNLDDSTPTHTFMDYSNLRSITLYSGAYTMPIDLM